jgi:hypothetical protein
MAKVLVVDASFPVAVSNWGTISNWNKKDTANVKKGMDENGNVDAQANNQATNTITIECEISDKTAKPGVGDTIAFDAGDGDGSLNYIVRDVEWGQENNGVQKGTITAEYDVPS